MTDSEYKELAWLLGGVFVKKTRTVNGTVYVSRCIGYDLAKVGEHIS